MELKDILKEVIIASSASLNQNGSPENFDLEDFINVIESYYRELDDIGEFRYYEEDTADYDTEDGEDY
jgi:hypothetical protein